MREALFNKHAEFFTKLRFVKVLDIDTKRQIIALNIRGSEYIATAKKNNIQDLAFVLSRIDAFELDEIDYAYFRKLLACVNDDTIMYQNLLLLAKHLSKKILDLFIEACEYTATYKIINTELFKSLQVEIDAINTSAN